MIALLMCGGKGKRLGMGEKPLVKVLGKKLVDHMLDNLIEFDVIAVTSKYTEKTETYLKMQGIDCYKAKGEGFVEDYMEAVKQLRLFEPLIVASSDVIIFKDSLINEIVDFYFKSQTKALQTVYKKPIGINIIDGYFIDDWQDEVIYKIKCGDAININTKRDIKKAEEIWKLMNLEKREKN